MTEKEAAMEVLAEMNVDPRTLFTSFGEFNFGSLPAVVRQRAEEKLAAANAPVPPTDDPEPPPPTPPIDAPPEPTPTE